jgi:hypothetical protein
MSHLLIDKRIHIGRLFFCLALLGACSQEAELKRLTPPHHDRLAREFLTAVRGDDSVSILKQVTPALQVQGFRDTLRLIASSLPAGSIDTLRQVGLTRTRKDGEFRTELIYELHTPSGWGSATIAILEERGIRSVSGFRVNRLPGSIKGTSGFSLSGRSPAHFLMLLLALGCAGLSIVAAVLVAKEKIQRRSLWALFALLGVAPVTLNWATGGVSFQLLSVVLFSAGAVRPGLGGPWLVSVAFPIGAISALRRVRHARAERALARTEAAEPVEISPAS